MEFFVYERIDSALLVVPALFQLPVACQCEGTVRRVGCIDIDIDALSADVSQQLADHGYAVVAGDDCLLVRTAMAASASETT